MKFHSSAAFFTALLLATSLFSRAYAQSPAPSASPVAAATAKGHFQDFDPNERLARLTRRLDLSMAQQTQLLAILQKEEDSFKSINGDATLDDAKKEKKLRQASRAAREGTVALLTPAQQAQLRPKAPAQKNDGASASASPSASASASPAAQ